MAWGWDEKSDAQVKEVNHEGEVVWSWFARDHLDDADNRRGPDSETFDGTYTHTNSVIRLDNGNTLISVRNFNMLVEVDLTGEIVWSLQDVFENPHDPEILPNGNILVGDHARPHKTMEVTRDGEVVWSWSRPVLRAVRYNHLLPNGNILLTDRMNIIEITPGGRIVWQLELLDVEPDKWMYKAERISR